MCSDMIYVVRNATVLRSMLKALDLDLRHRWESLVDVISSIEYNYCAIF